ncbi:MAG: D-glycerate dehydrogenase [Candidatus Cloacimonetes bacterium]|nr:D-glycerate dehydrogenase [Candidatus Cloacimonadota bacterium]
MLDLFLTRKLPAKAMQRLETNFHLRVNPDDRVLASEEIIEGVRDADILLCLLTDTIDRAIIDAGANLRGIVNYAVGYNNIDVDYATSKGLPVTNTPGVLTDTTADMAWALMFAAARRVIEGDRFTRANHFEGWGPLLLLGVDVHGATLGIVGAGRIGEAVARRSVGFGMRVLYSDHKSNPALERDIDARHVPLDHLLKQSDFVSLHVPMSSATRYLIGASELEMMKPDAVLINTSRGPVVDEAALVAALQSGVIRAAALDVYEDEPALAHGLAQLDNVVLAPHIASASEATRTRMGIMAADNAIAIAQGERPPQLINPQVWQEER